MKTLEKLTVGAGSVTKKEKVIEINTKISGTTVFEVEEPFPGYYHDVPVTKSINSIFLLVKGMYYPETILRATNLVKSKYSIDFEAAYSRLSFGSNKDTYVTIRLSGLHKYDDIVVLQKAYSDVGIKFEKNIEVDISNPVIINVNKVLSIHETIDGVFYDEGVSNKNYITIDKGGDWEWFEDVTNKVKNNFRRRNFDVAHAVIFKPWGLQEMVRIFDDKITVEELLELQKLYNRFG